MKHSIISIIILNAALGVTALGTVSAQHDGHDKHAGAHDAPTHAMPAAPYLLDSDPVSGKPLGARETLVSRVSDGRELLFASEETAKQFDRDPESVLEKLDAAIIRLQLPQYALKNCVVSGDSLEESGDKVVNFVSGNRLVRVCCAFCEPKVRAHTEQYLAKLDAAIVAAQKPAYPLDTCVVSGEALGGSMGDPVDVIVGNTLVRMCCAGCRKQIDANPRLYLGKLAKATSEHADMKGEHDDNGHDHGGGDHK